MRIFKTKITHITMSNKNNQISPAVLSKVKQLMTDRSYVAGISMDDMTDEFILTLLKNDDVDLQNRTAQCTEPVTGIITNIKLADIGFNYSGNKEYVFDWATGGVVNFKKIKKLVDQSIYILGQHISFISEIFSNVAIIYVPSIPTMATTGTIILINPSFVLKLQTLDKYAVAAVLMHEAYHCVLCHLDRCKSGSYDHQKFNIAGDYEINVLLAHEPYTTDDGNVVESLFDSDMFVKIEGLWDEKYLGWSAEEIYAYLEENNKWPPMPPEPQEGSGDGEGEGGSGEGEGNQQSDGDQSDQQNGQNGPGQQDGQGSSQSDQQDGQPGQRNGQDGQQNGQKDGQANQDGQGGSKEEEKQIKTTIVKEIKKEIQKGLTKHTTLSDDIMSKSEADKSIKDGNFDPSEINDSNTDRMKELARRICNGLGKAMMKTLDAIEHIKLGDLRWQDILRKYMKLVLNNWGGVTKKRYNVRSSIRRGGVYTTKPKQNLTLPSATIMIDISGSINEPLLNIFINETMNIAASADVEKINLVFWSVGVDAIFENLKPKDSWKRAIPPDLLEKIKKVTSGGGNDLHAVYKNEKFKSVIRKSRCVVHFTDCYYDIPEEPTWMAGKEIWVIYNSESDPGYGRRLFVDVSDNDVKIK